MTDSSLITEEPLRERPAEVITADGPESEIPDSSVTDDDAVPPAGDTAAAATDDAGADEASEGGDDEGEGDEDEGQDSGEDKPPRHGKRSWQKRVDRLTKRNGELERAIAEERGRRLALEEIAAKAPASPAAKTEEPPPAPEEPQPEDFDTVEDYAKAYAKFEREQDAAKATTKPATEPQGQAWAPSKESEKVRQASFEAAKEAFKDVEERLDKVGPQLTLPMLKAVEFDEDGATILAALADHPEELKAIRALTDESRVAKALQRFAGKVLSAAPESKPPATPGDDTGTTEDDTPRIPRNPTVAPVSRAKPVGTVLAGSRVSGSVDVESMSQAEYEAYMNKRRRGW